MRESKVDIQPRDCRLQEKDDVLDIQGAALLLKTTATSIASMARRGTLPARKCGRSWRFSKNALLTWLARDAMTTHSVKTERSANSSLPQIMPVDWSQRRRSQTRKKDGNVGVQSGGVAERDTKP